MSSEPLIEIQMLKTLQSVKLNTAHIKLQALDIILFPYIQDVYFSSPVKILNMALAILNFKPLICTSTDTSHNI